jgi:phage terminase Nu1 subunit (DNA packaging protein)
MIKHSKYRNTGILFELLVRQTTADLLENKDSKAIKIIKKYFTNTDLGKEYNLYNSISTSKKLTEVKAEMLISTVLEQYKKLDNKAIDRLKYNLIKEIKKSYNIDEFFKAKIDNYKSYAAIYTIFESQYGTQSNTEQLIANKVTLLEKISVNSVASVSPSASLVEDLMKEDKEIRLLTYKIIVEQFNKKYKSLSQRQKDVLSEYIGSISDTQTLRESVNKRLVDIKKELTQLTKTVESPVVKIKLSEAIKLIVPIKENITIKDEIVTSILQYYELIDEIKSIK